MVVRHAKRRPLIFAGVIAALLFGGGAVILNLRSRGIEWVTPKVGPIVESIYGIGTVTPRQQYRLRIGVPKRIIRLFVQEGADVKKGEPLVTFDDGLTSRAPFAGTVTGLPFFEGEDVFPNTVILALENLTDVYVEATLEQQGVIRVKRGMPVRLSFESIRDKKFDARVRAVLPQDGQFLVHIDMDQLPEGVLPGMTADVAIEIARREDAFLIPALAISNGRVVVRRDGKDQKIDVQVGSMDGSWAEITSGNILPKDQIVIKKR